jgi:hypothetical protein
VPDLFRCRCSCLDPTLLTVGIGDGAYAMRRYQFSPSCATKPIDFISFDYEPAWVGLAETRTVNQDIGEGVPFTFCDGSTTITATMTASGIGVGEVEIKVFDESENLIARYLNDVVWQPNCWTQFVLVEYDPACGEVWDAHPCLGPGIDPCTCAHCAAGQVAFTVDWSGIELDDETLFPGATALANQKVTLECVPYALVDPVFGVSQGDCFWQAQIFRSSGGDNYKLSWLIQFDELLGGGGGFITQLRGDKIGDPLGNFLLVAGSIFAGDDDTWCNNGPWLHDDTSEFAHYTARIEAVVIPGTSRPEIRFNCDPQPEPSNCNGESLWTLKAYTFGSTYLFYWRLDSESCEGTNCVNGKTCLPVPPFELPRVYIDAVEAERLEILDLLNQQIAGYCGCADPYVRPTPIEPCEGLSSWILRREPCETNAPGEHQWYWEHNGNTCAGTCGDDETCTPRPPFPLPTTPISDAEADALGLTSGLNQNFSDGSCDCDTPYVGTRCPDCDCDSVTGAKAFILSGATGDYESWNGEWSGLRGVNDCEPEPCCWSMIQEGGVLGPYSLSWNGGVWTMVLGDATYTASGTACDDPIIMTRTAGTTSMPGTITVTNT